MSFHIVKNYKQEKHLFQQRLWLVVIFVVILTALLSLRLFYLQILENHTYTTLSEQNRLMLLPIEPSRGLIFDRNNVLLAENIPVFSLDVLPNQTENLDLELDELQKIISLTPTELDQFDKNWQEQKRLQPVTLKLNLNEEEVAKFYLNQYRLPGFTVNTHLIRHYPLGATTVAALGYMSRINTKELSEIDQTNYKASNFIGKVGLEKYYENDLHGKIGYQQVEIDMGGRIIRVLKRITPQSGVDLYLTIDSKLQAIAQEALGAENGAVVAIEPQTGEIITFVSNPTYDPNMFIAGVPAKTFHELQNSPNKPMYNRAVRGQFPPGSTIKPFIALEGLDSGTINPDYTINDPGWFKLPNSTHLYHNATHVGYGKINVVNSIIVSCDTFFYNLATLLGINKIDSMLQRFGFGEKIGLDIGEEVAGNVPSPAWKMRKTNTSWYPGDTVISGIGQGFMLVTPLQLAYGVATIANHGMRIRPHLAYKVKTASGNTFTIQPIQDPPIKLNNPKNWNIVIKAMEGVISSINPRGTGRVHFGTDVAYSVAAKTGTAQLFRHYFDENQAAEEAKLAKRLRNDSLFIAFAPVDKPKIAIAVIAENSAIAGSVARKVLDAYLIKKF